MSKKKETKKEITEVVFILDRSGSMGGLEEDTIGGFNATLKKQKKEGENILWSTVLFDDKTEVVHDRVPVEKVKELDEDTYYVRGCTALLDAVGGAIHHIATVHKYAREEDRPDKTMFIITTDGMENASTIYSYRKVEHMIKREQEKYGWEFVFLGANMDAVEVAGRMGIRENRAARFHNDARGIALNYETVNEMITDFACGIGIAEDRMDRIRADYKQRKGKNKEGYICTER